jgi:hypothetical protein
MGSRHPDGVPVLPRAGPGSWAVPLGRGPRGSHAIAALYGGGGHNTSQRADAGLPPSPPRGAERAGRAPHRCASAEPRGTTAPQHHGRGARTAGAEALLVSMGVVKAQRTQR